MKNISKSFLLVSALGISTAALGSSCPDEFQWVFGLDYYQAWRKVKHNSGRILPKSFPGATLYLGGRWETLGFELGYDASIKAKKSWTLLAGERIGNFTVSRNASGTTQVQFRGLHLDLLAYLPLDCFRCTEWFAAIGYGHATGFRLGGGVNYMLTECLGLRAKIGYEHNATVRVANNTIPGLDHRPYTNAGTFSLGGFVKF